MLDACAAPGGKATHLAELMGDLGEVWAIDRSAGRLQRVAANAARLGTNCLQAMAADAADLLTLKPEWKGSFQRILLDAPCSGLGTLARHADARWRVSAKVWLSWSHCRPGCWRECCRCSAPAHSFTPPPFIRLKTQNELRPLEAHPPQAQAAAATMA